MDTNTRQPLSDTVDVRRVIGDTPEHGRHLLWDSGTDRTTPVFGGLAFTIGVATIEAEAAKDHIRFWQVQHPNGVPIYHIHWVPTGNVAVTRVG